MSDDDFRPGDYWEGRLSANLDLTTVGHAGLGSAYNAWLYRARYRALRRALAAAGITVAGRSVVEIGVGSGAYIGFWESQDVGALTGLDITRVSVESLAARYPEYTFAQCDIGHSLPGGIRRDYDLVTAFDVLFHIVDDSNFARAIGNLARLARPGGHVLVSDSLADRAWGPTRTEYHRTYAQYLAEMAKHGVCPVRIEPIFYTMTTTFAGSGGLARFTGATTRTAGRLAARPVTAWANEMIGGGLYAVDGLLARSGERGPSLNLLVARKDEADASAR
jgi:SAM-dependent methyltransferase